MKKKGVSTNLFVSYAFWLACHVFSLHYYYLLPELGVQGMLILLKLVKPKIHWKCKIMKYKAKLTMLGFEHGTSWSRGVDPV